MKPILFNTEMVKVLLDGRKTVTRRALKGDAREHIQIDVDNSVIGIYDMFEGTVRPVSDYAPYRPGDILYVRETWAEVPDLFGEFPQPIYKADIKGNHDYDLLGEVKWHPSIHMPREAARIFLRVTGVRVERLQEIDKYWSNYDKEGMRNPKTENISIAMQEKFISIWDSTIKKSDLPLYGWNASPWVWVIEFERISKEDANNA